MRAIILAAGRGMRLQQSAAEQYPKCLLRFDGTSLLERHLQMLDNAGVDEVVLALGYQPEKIEAELDHIGWRSRVEIVLNPDYELGSVLTVHTVADAMTRGGDVLLMDADVLYDERILDALVAGDRIDRLLIDRGFKPGDEPVKVCVKDGEVVEFRKQVATHLDYDTIGESVGFFRFRNETAVRFMDIVAGYVESGRSKLPHEEAIRDLLLDGDPAFDIADTTGAPWIEIDFPGDIARANNEVLPLMQPIGATR